MDVVDEVVVVALVEDVVGNVLDVTVTSTDDVEVVDELVEDSADGEEVHAASRAIAAATRSIHHRRILTPFL